MTKILVADDDHLVAKLLKLELSQKGFDIITAYDGEEAWKLIDSNAIPDIVILDVNMPRMNGFEVLDNIKSHDHTKHLPVIMLTARNSREDLSGSLNTGIIDYVLKPFTLDQVLSRVLMAHRKMRKGMTELPKRELPHIEAHEVAAKVEPAHEAPKAEQKTPKEETSTHILFVEYFEANKQSLTKPLEKLGYQVTVVTAEGQENTEQEVFNTLDAGNFDAVVIDGEPNYLDGYILTHAIRMHDRQKNVIRAIIGLGTEPKTGGDKKWLLAGMNDYFQKPVFVKHVVESIQKHL